MRNQKTLSDFQRPFELNSQDSKESDFANSIQRAEKNPHIKEYEDFLKSGIKKVCKCGCGDEIIIKPHHRQYGIPDYIKGHNSNGRFISLNNNSHIKDYKDFLRLGIMKFCKCGCGKEIIMKTHYKYEGIPNYIGKHYLLTKSYEEIYGIEKAKDIIKKLKKKIVWNKGLKGSIAWNKGLTKETNESVKKYADKKKGIVFTDDHKKKLSLIKKKAHMEGYVVWNKGMKGFGKGHHCSEEHRKKISLTNSTPEAIERARQRRLKQIFPIKDSKPELKLQNILKENNILFETHKAIKGQPDIFFSEKKLAVFVDGCYFHLCRLCKRIKMTNHNKNSEIRDKQVTEILQSQGYIVLRFWEHEINNNIQECLNKIQEVI